MGGIYKGSIGFGDVWGLIKFKGIQIAFASHLAGTSPRCRVDREAV